MVEKKRKTLLVLSCRGGGGHTAASLTLQKLLGSEYDIQIIHPIEQLRIYGIPCADQLYNSMLQNGWTRSMNFIVRYIAPHLFRSREEKLERIIHAHIENFQPDLIISLIPFVNYPASEAARKQQVPYLLVTTDNDLRHWVLRLEKLKHPDFRVTIGADLITSRDLLLKKNIPESAIETIGLPLRPEFIVEKDEEKIREELGIPQKKPITLIMMGGAGGSKSYDYAKKIGTMDLSTHIIVIMGRNEKIKKELEKISLHPSNSMTLLGFTERVADLMAISHVIVTKPGPGTISEAIAMKLPILIDSTDKLLFWERINVEMVLNYGIGERITDSGQIAYLLETYLSDAEIKEHLQDSFVSIPPNHFHLKIKGIVKEMVAQRERNILLQRNEQKTVSAQASPIQSNSF
ncbi:MAG TPA: hypothetical protein VGJ00_09120 [Rhabdochlamydiaceae bacterium]